MTLPGEQISVSVSISYNADATVNLAFDHVQPDDVDSLLESLGTPEFKQSLIDGLAEAVRERRELSGQ